MKTVFLLILVLLSSGFYESVQAQNAMILGGKVSNVKLLEENAQSIAFEVELQLTLRNASESPAILYSHQFSVVGVQVFTKTTKGIAELLDVGSSLSSTDLSPVWNDLRRQLSVKTPPSDLTRTVASGQWIELERVVTLRFYKKKLRIATWDEIRARAPLFLRITLEVFPNNLDYDRKLGHGFGKSLQSKWRRLGRLQFEPVVSEPIQIELATIDRANNRGPSR